MLPFKLVYHPEYDLNLGAHVFPSHKYRLIRDALLAEGTADTTDFLLPEPATDEDMLRVHTPEWIGKLRNGQLTPSEEMHLEIPYSPQTVRAFWLAAGGSILAARRALEDGFAVNLTGGFHHAFPSHGEGFCMIHDVAVSIRRLQSEGLINTAMTVDTDVHQGNGTAAIFAIDSRVFTFSIHQLRNYPNPKPPSDMDIELADGTGDADYLRSLELGLAESLRRFQPDLICYLGGADPYREDQLGGLRLSIEGLRQRDELVFARARRQGVPVAIMLAGGYARHVEDTVRIHANTVLAARDIAENPISTSS